MAALRGRWTRFSPAGSVSSAARPPHPALLLPAAQARPARGHRRAGRPRGHLPGEAPALPRAARPGVDDVGRAEACSTRAPSALYGTGRAEADAGQKAGAPGKRPVPCATAQPDGCGYSWRTTRPSLSPTTERSRCPPPGSTSSPKASTRAGGGSGRRRLRSPPDARFRRVHRPVPRLVGHADSCSSTRHVQLRGRPHPQRGSPPFPHSSAVKTSRHSHMRELRVTTRPPIRVFYAFDPRRSAILLVGGYKTTEKRFYRDLVHQADALYDEHLQEIRLERSNHEGPSR